MLDKYCLGQKTLGQTFFDQMMGTVIFTYIKYGHDRGGDALHERFQLVGVRNVDVVESLGHVLHQLHRLRPALHVERLGQELVADDIGGDG